MTEGGDGARDRLRSVARAIVAGDQPQAEAQLRTLLADLEHQGDGGAVGDYVFGAALAQRISRRTVAEANLYLNRFDVPQIHLFNLLASEVPQVGLTTVIANRCIASSLSGLPHPTVIDVGIGTGRQIAVLLDELGSAGRLPGRITVIGIEPSDWSLSLAEKQLRAAAQRLGVDLTFHALCGTAEALTRDDWLKLASWCSSRPVINASFALHHIGDVDGRDVRDDVLLRLRSLDPAALVLSEPNVHHLERDFLARFDHCLHHFGVTFAALDRLPIPAADRDALKVCFFGREIADILGNPEDQRTERHERTSSWVERLSRTGYRAAIDVELPPSGPVISVARHPDHVSLDFGEERLVAVLCGVPAEGASDVQGALSRAPSRAIEQPHTEPLDVGFYLAALSAVAHSDGVLHRHERLFIDEQARIFGVDRSQLPSASLDEILAGASAVQSGTREAIVRDLVFLARLDGDYHDSERRMIASVAARLGFDERALSRLEQPPAAALPGGPSWFRELWFIGAK